MTYLASSGTETFTPTQLFAGDADVITQPVTVKSGSNLAQYTVVGRIDATGKIVACDLAANDGSQRAIGILVNAIDASGGDKAGTIYIAGDFNRAALVWHASFDTDLKKTLAFDRTNIVTRALAYSNV